MFYFLLLYVLFFYFKLARVHRKEEVLIPTIGISHLMVMVAAVLLYRYGFTHYSSVLLLVVSFLFFIVAALNVTAVQLGIFKDGKPMLGLTTLYKTMPFLALLLLGSGFFLQS